MTRQNDSKTVQTTLTMTSGDDVDHGDDKLPYNTIGYGNDQT